VEAGGGTEYYGYAPDNKRIYKMNSSGWVAQITFYGAKGEKLGVYSVGGGMALTTVSTSVWFAGKLICEGACQGPVGAAGTRFRPIEMRLLRRPTIGRSLGPITGTAIRGWIMPSRGTSRVRTDPQIQGRLQMTIRPPSSHITGALRNNSFK